MIFAFGSHPNLPHFQWNLCIRSWFPFLWIVAPLKEIFLVFIFTEELRVLIRCRLFAGHFLWERFLLLMIFVVALESFKIANSYIMCLQDEEYVFHLILNCLFANMVQSYCFQLFGEQWWCRCWLYSRSCNLMAIWLEWTEAEGVKWGQLLPLTFFLLWLKKRKYLDGFGHFYLMCPCPYSTLFTLWEF